MNCALWIMILIAPHRTPAPDPAVVAAGATVGQVADWYAVRVATPPRPRPFDLAQK